MEYSIDIENFKRSILKIILIFLSVFILLLGVFHSMNYSNQTTISQTIELQWLADSTWTSGWNQ